MKLVNCIDASYAGGEAGMEVTWHMIRDSLELLAIHGALYLFLVFENDVTSIIDKIQL